MTTNTILMDGLARLKEITCGVFCPAKAREMETLNWADEALDTFPDFSYGADCYKALRKAALELGYRSDNVTRCVLVGICLAVSFFLVSKGQAAALSQPEYRLQLFHIHTAERLNIVYRRGDHYIPEALIRLDRFMRDHRTGAVRHYDPRVFDLLYAINHELGRANGEIDIVCGYRSPWSNEFLRAHGHGVAAHSLHVQAMAIDIRMPGVKTLHLRDAALALQGGGVGYYAASDFVHVDVGRVRRW